MATRAKVKSLFGVVLALVVAADARDASSSARVISPVTALTGKTIFGLKIVGKDKVWVIRQPVRWMDAELGRFGFAGGTTKSEECERRIYSQKYEPKDSPASQIHI